MFTVIATFIAVTLSVGLFSVFALLVPAFAAFCVILAQILAVMMDVFFVMPKIMMIGFDISGVILGVGLLFPALDTVLLDVRPHRLGVSFVAIFMVFTQLGLIFTNVLGEAFNLLSIFVTISTIALHVSPIGTDILAIFVGVLVIGCGIGAFGVGG